jgi:hypothetical protein
VTARFLPLPTAALVALVLLASGCRGGGDAGSPETAAISDTLEYEGKKVIPGRWRKARTPRAARALTPEQEEAIERLESIGYVAGSRPARAERSLTVYDPDRAHAGLNFFTSGHFPGAVLMDMEGEVLHVWEKKLHEVWPEIDPEPFIRLKDFWRRAHLFPNGNVIAIFEGVGIFELDRDSNLIWANRNGAHHDLEVMPDGRIYVLTREARVIERLHPTEPVLEDFVTVLAPEGREISRTSVIECFENSRFSSILAGGRLGSGDIFHTNTLRVLNEDDRRTAWHRKGNILTCARNIHAIAVLDLEKRSTLDVWGGPFYREHDPKMLENGLMLLFDNEGGPDSSSRAVEYDPARREIVWEFRGARGDTLRSPTLGAVQRLPGGTTLITESDNGRALEVTRDGEVVWEYHNPHRVGEAREYIATIFEMKRLPADFPRWLDR